MIVKLGWGWGAPIHRHCHPCFGHVGITIGITTYEPVLRGRFAFDAGAAERDRHAQHWTMHGRDRAGAPARPPDYDRIIVQIRVR
jgi:hypothetical protein